MRNRIPVTLLKANHVEEFRGQLKSIDIAVPLRSEGRTANHVEVYAIAYLLATLSPDYWKFPMEVVHRDRPDFLLRTRGRNIGIEHVEIVPKNEAWMARLREEGHGPDVHFIRHASLDEPIRSRCETIREIEADEAGDGWAGDSAEREWAEAAAHCAMGKVGRANRPGFESFDETWLMMYDNWPLPAIDPRKSASFLLEQPSMATVLQRFRRVFVMDDRRLWEFSNEASFHVLHDPHSACSHF